VITSYGSRTSAELALTRSSGAALARGLDAPLLGLPGAGPVTARRLAARGLRTVRDLLLRLPRTYDDLRLLTPLAALSGVADGSTVLVRGCVRRVHVFPRRLLDVVIEQDGGVLRARWFRPAPGMAKGFVKGSEVVLAGPLHTAKDGTRELLHPANVTAALAARAARSEAGAGPGLGVRPRYAVIEGVGARLLERLTAAALDVAASDATDAEVLPGPVRERLGLPPLLAALRAIHAPSGDIDAATLTALAQGRDAVHRRIVLEELLTVQVAFLLHRAETRALPAPASVNAAFDQVAVLARVREALGFPLTAAQERAVEEIGRDLGGTHPMQRLLIGDVGSGKTAVAFAAAALAAAAGGGQTLMMVPTEVLAEQHARTLGPMAARVGLSIAVLTAGASPAVRRTVRAACAAGRVHLLVGTQALLDPTLRLPDLRLVIVDEQHRFGVAQRATVRSRGGGLSPHLLVMSATPIPRTLALARHGDLDVSVLDERPAGRHPPATLVCRGEDQRRAAYDRLRDTIAARRQAFVVCAVREQARRAGAVTAISRYAELRRQLAPARVGLLHGALEGSEKERVLRTFSDGGLDVLVATTVVELGIDVPRATLMIVEDADRFGLAQLHQLRGRVGRGAEPGLCLLCTSNEGAADGAALTRLDLLAATTDGFRLAELDLAARGFGDLFGTRQSGAPATGQADLRELFSLVEIARREAELLLQADPALARPEHRALAAAARAKLVARALFDEEAG
jgi:ATP-dependent DNA helicase RecG